MLRKIRLTFAMVSGDSEFYIKNQGKIATACSLSLIT